MLLIYDVSSRASFSSMEKWFEEAEVNTAPGVALYLVGTKVDKPNRAVSTLEGRTLAEAHGAKFCEVSAKTNEDVRRPFVEIVDEVVARGVQGGGGGTTSGTVRVGQGVEDANAGGCSC